MIETTARNNLSAAGEQKIEFSHQLVDEETARMLEELPIGARIKAELATLWDVYEKRRAGATFHYGDEIYEFEVLATRYHDGQGVEEWYRQTDVYSHDNKNYVGRRVDIEIQDGDATWAITATEADNVLVYKMVNGQSQPCSEEQQANVIFEFFHRSSDAASKHASRSPLEQQAADTEAHDMIRERYPELFAPISTLE